MPAILLMRHGQPALRGVILGATDPCLSDAGHEQARSVAAAIDGLAGEQAPCIVYSSPLRRALQTASYLLSPRRPLVVLHDLREISYGDWDGLSWADIERANPDLAREKANDWLRVTVPGGESWPVFAERVGRALDHIRRGPLPALVVAHQGVNAEIAYRLSGARQTEFQQAYCEVIPYANESH